MHIVEGPCEGARAVVVTHLQMLDPSHLRSSAELTNARLMKVEHDRADRSREFYSAVGAPWHWVDRITWTDEQWQQWTDREEHHLFVMTADGAPVGYVELEQQPEGTVEIAYLGLLPGCSGSGRGGWLLTRALEQAWALPDTRRVWVHTCDLDAPAALANYRARGMQEFARTVEWRMPAPDTVSP